MLIIGLVIPHSNKNLLSGANNVAVSPFTPVVSKVGAKSAVDNMNAIILITIISAGNSGVYSSNRTLMGLANDGYVPKFFGKVNRWCVPIYEVSAICFVFFLGLLTSLFGSGVVFNWRTLLTSMAGLITWMIISITHLELRYDYLSENRSLSDMPYVAPLFLFCDIFVIVIDIIVIFGQGDCSFIGDISPGNAIGSYIGLILAVVLYVGRKALRRPAFVKYEEMGFETGTLQIEQVCDTNDDDELNPNEKELPVWKRNKGLHHYR
ncbi:unnamed protein product [Absidia cylindrospora]